MLRHSLGCLLCGLASSLRHNKTGRGIHSMHSTISKHVDFADDKNDGTLLCTFFFKSCMNRTSGLSLPTGVRFTQHDLEIYELQSKANKAVG